MRNARLLLDREHDAQVREHYLVIDTERTLLSNLFGSEPLMIRGRRLCRWTERICAARGWNYEEATSPTLSIRRACPTLTDADAQEIARDLGSRIEMIEEPVNTRLLLMILQPDGPWNQEPSRAHAATWLFWLNDTAIPNHYLPLINDIADGWESRCHEGEDWIYKIRTADKAHSLLQQWLGLTVDDITGMMDPGKFPLDTLPDQWVTAAHDAWSLRIVTEGPVLFQDILKRGLPIKLRKTIADLTYQYIRQHPNILTQKILQSLTVYLSPGKIQELRRIIPPSPPGEIPKELDIVETWFSEEYLPYRAWEVEYGDEAAHECISRTTRSFALWYLSAYPTALAGGEGRSNLNISSAEKAKHAIEREVTLWVVLDGLHYSDAQIISSGLDIPRLTLEQNKIVYSTLPTITDFAKKSLLTGLPPVRACALDDNAVIQGAKLLREHRDPAKQLNLAQPGDLFIWRIEEPDKTYHKPADAATTITNVQGELAKIAERIKLAALAVPDSHRLRIIISTDHGRMMGTCSRKYSIPAGMQAHGRTAWGPSNLRFSGEGVIINTSEDIAYLSAERFQLPQDCAVILNDGAFLTSDGRRGEENYTHGGLYPEEVLIPWLVFARDRIAPKMTAVAEGKGRVGVPGTITVTLRNPSPLNIQVIAIELRVPGHNWSFTPGINVEPFSALDFDDIIDAWPTKALTERGQVIITFAMPDGTQFPIQADTHLETEEMYSRDILLEDL